MRFGMNLTRRGFLRASGVSLALPWLEALAPRRARGAEGGPPRRMVCMCMPLGIHPPLFFPKNAGREYELSPYLELIKEFRDDFTVMSGLSHPEVPEAHDSGFVFLTGAHHSGYVHAGFRNTISVDQLAAAQIGGETRFPSLSLSTEGGGLSWTRTGVQVPSDLFPSSVFAKLFLDGSPERVQAEIRRLRRGRSILDQIGDETKKLERGLGAGDREKLDEYFTSVRELERQLGRGEEWSKKPKPKVDAAPPDNPPPEDLVRRTRIWFDLTHLALATDSTRLVTIYLTDGMAPPPIAGVTMGHHDLSHHGQDPTKLSQLQIVETETMKLFGDFLGKLKRTRETDGASLLDQTSVFLGSNLGSGSSHSTTNLPVILAGGGFKHGQHLAFDPQNHPPLCNVFVSMLQRLGVAAEKFGSSTGGLAGLEAG